MTNSGWDGTERRIQRERRSNDRHGKYDRRRNRCVRCEFYQIQDHTQGFCEKHQKIFSAESFVCPLFQEKP